jgi:hypothetical protein
MRARSSFRGKAGGSRILSLKLIFDKIQLAFDLC